MAVGMGWLGGVGCGWPILIFAMVSHPIVGVCCCLSYAPVDICYSLSVQPKGLLQPACCCLHIQQFILLYPAVQFFLRAALPACLQCSTLVATASLQVTMPPAADCYCLPV